MQKKRILALAELKDVFNTFMFEQSVWKQGLRKPIIFSQVKHFAIKCFDWHCISESDKIKARTTILCSWDGA